MTIVALGALLLPALVKGGYQERFGLGLVTTSGSLGLLVVPSLPLILYGIVAQQLGVGEPFTLTDLFLAGLMPVAIMLIALIVYTLVTQGRVRAEVADDAPNWRQALWAARFELPLPVVILGGIYSGWLPCPRRPRSRRSM